MSTSTTGRVSIGTAAQRPAGGAAGDGWFATDTGILSFYTGSIWKNVEFGAGGDSSLALLEAAAPSGAANQDIIYADSTAHRLKTKNNNGSAETIASLEVAQTFSALQMFTSGIAGLGKTFSNLNADGSTGSTTYVTFYSLSAITTRGGGVIVVFVVPATAIVANGIFTISQDAVDGNILATIRTTGTADAQTVIATGFSPSAGSHTYALRGNTGAGGTLNTNCASVSNGFGFAIELSQ